MTIRAIIFDLDGTLADTLADITSSLNHVLEDLDLPTHDCDTTVAWVGWGVRYLVDRAVPESHSHLVDEATARFRAHYAAHLIVETKPYPGVPELLDAVALPISVLSNKPDAMTRRILDEVFGRWQFVDPRGRRDGVPHKPDPIAALEIARSLGCPPANIAFVGDTAVDMQTAVAAGMVPVAVSWGFRSAAELAGGGARAVVDSPAELLSWLRRGAASGLTEM